MGNQIIVIIESVYLRVLIIFLTFFSMGGHVFALSLEEALDAALNTNSEIIAARQTYKLHVENVNQIASSKLPSISANVSGNRIWDLKNDDDTDNLSADLTANYTLFDGNLIDHSITAEKFRLSSAKAQLLAVEQKVLFDSVVAYLNVLRDMRLVALSKKNVAFLRQQLDASTSRYELGEVTLTDVAQATAALEAATSVLVSREGLLNLSTSLFETIVGAKAENLEVNIELPILPDSLEEAKKLAEKYNLTLKSTIFIEKRAKALWDASKSKSFPTLSIISSLSSGQSVADNDYANFGISLRGSIPIYNGGSLKSGERGAYSSLEAAMANTTIVRLNVMQQVMTAWSDIKVSSSIISARIRQVEATELAHQGISEEARLGSRTTLDVLESEQSLMNTKTDLETALSNRLVAAYRLLMQTGTLTPSSLGISSALLDEHSDIN